MVNLSLLIKANHNHNRLIALNIINDEKNESSVKNANKTLHIAVDTGASADVKIQPLTRYYNDVATGISNVIKEQNITDLVIGLQPEKGFTPSFVHNLHNGYLQNNNVNTLIYHASQPISTVKRYLVLIPAKAQQEAGFFSALLRVWNIAKNSGAVMRFYADDSIIKILQRVISKSSIEASLHSINNWEEAQHAATNLLKDEGLIVFMSKRGMISYFKEMS